MLASVIGLLQQESIHPTPLASSKQQPKAEGEAGEKQMWQKQGETSESWGLAEADVLYQFSSDTSADNFLYSIWSQINGQKNANISQHSNLCVLFKSGTQTSHR